MQTVGTPQELATLYKKLAELMKSTGRVAKSGRNTFHGYDYVTEGDVVEEVRGKLPECGLAFFESSGTIERIQLVAEENAKKRPGDVTRVEMFFTLACTDTGASITSKIYGEGQDAADKGVYKAMTGAQKYFWMKLLCLPTGDDPEEDKRKKAEDSDGTDPSVEETRETTSPWKNRK